MSVYKRNFALFFKSKLCRITYSLSLLICPALFLVRYIIQNADIQFLTALSEEYTILKTAMIYFIIFVFLSFVYFSKAKQAEIQECIAVTKTGNVRFVLSQFSVLAALALISSIIVLLFSFISAVRFNITDNRFYWQAACAAFAYFFIADIIAALLGLLCSHIESKALSYSLLIFIALMFTPFSNVIPETLYSATEKINLYPIFSIFNIYPKEFSGINHSYGIVLNQKSVFLLVFWAALLSFLIFLLQKFRDMRIKLSVMGLSVILIFTGIIGTALPFSDYADNHDPKKGISADAWYYMINKYDNKPVMQYEQQANFGITAYDMNLKIDRVLTAEVNIHVDKSSLTEYKFTLYHGYKINEITDKNGTVLEFNRDGDYVTVYPKESTDAIIFRYKGFSPNYYSNSQGTFLPAGFTYYPINGFHYIYDVGLQGRIGVTLNDEVPIDVKVQTSHPVFSNLDRVSGNEFSGMADSLTLVSGYYNEKEINGCRLVYSSLDTVNCSDDYLENEFAGFIGNNKNVLDGKTIIIAPSVFSGAKDTIYFETSDSIISLSFAEITANLNSDTDSGKSIKANMELYYSLASFNDKDSRVYKYYCQINNGENDTANKSELDYIVAEKIAEYGYENVKSSIGSMIFDTGHGLTSAELAKSIIDFETYAEDAGR